MCMPQSVPNGGLLCITATDMIALAGAQADTCYKKYASMPAKGTVWCHEVSTQPLPSHVQCMSLI